MRPSDLPDATIFDLVMPNFTLGVPACFLFDDDFYNTIGEMVSSPFSSSFKYYHAYCEETDIEYIL